LNTINLNKVERFAHVLGNTLCQEKGQTKKPLRSSKTWRKLTDEDIIALRILDDVTGDLARSLSNLHTPDPFYRALTRNYSSRFTDVVFILTTSIRDVLD